MKYSVLCALLLSVFTMNAMDFSSENQQVVLEHWRTLFNEECASDPGNPLLMLYRDMLLSLNEEDVQIALGLIVQATHEPEWEEFRAERDIESVMDFVQRFMEQLRDHIDPRCTLSFPPRLHAIDEHVQALGLDEQVACARIRQAFLAFTITVSLMSQMSDAL